LKGLLIEKLGTELGEVEPRDEDVCWGLLDTQGLLCLLVELKGGICEAESDTTTIDR
jgi:hypothetical protein